MDIIDNDAPVLTLTSPVNGEYLQSIAQITATLADTLGTVDDAAVLASFVVNDSTQQSVAGTITEAENTFIFVPTSLPLADETYTVSLNSADTYGNTQNYSFNFTIDTQPPGKPAITGGTVDSGTIQPRPVENTSSQFLVDLTGTREAGTSVWINSSEAIITGDTDWTVTLTLNPGSNTFEVWLKDVAGNQGESEWVDLEMQIGDQHTYEYNSSGRIIRIE